MPGQERDQGPLSSTSRKDPSSFGRKAAIPSERDPTLPKYAEPLRQIKDLAGVRVIAYFPRALSQIDQIIDPSPYVKHRLDPGVRAVRLLGKELIL